MSNTLGGTLPGVSIAFTGYTEEGGGYSTCFMTRSQIVWPLQAYVVGVGFLVLAPRKPTPEKGGLSQNV